MAMTEDGRTNIGVVREIYAVPERGAWDKLHELYDDKFLNNGVVMTAAEWRDLASGFYAAFDDVTHEIYEMSADGELVWTRSAMRGVQARSLTLLEGTFAPSGKKSRASGLGAKKDTGRASDGALVDVRLGNIHEPTRTAAALNLVER